MNYRPLPKCLTVAKSNIDGIGLFATDTILKDTVLGVSHVKNSDFEDGLIRTPLGGFFNHSIEPNCRILPDASSSNIFKLVTNKDIFNGEEITCKYTIYDPTL
jgi:SET domain-containing protein